MTAGRRWLIVAELLSTLNGFGYALGVLPIEVVVGVLGLTVAVLIHGVRTALEAHR